MRWSLYTLISFSARSQARRGPYPQRQLQRPQPVLAGHPRCAALAHRPGEVRQLQEQRFSSVLQERQLDDAGLPVPRALVRQVLGVVDTVDRDILPQQVDRDVVGAPGEDSIRILFWPMRLA